MSVLEAAKSVNAAESGRFARHLGVALGRAAGAEAAEAFRYFWDETPAVESSFGFREFPNLTPPRVAPLFLEGDAPERAMSWVVPLRDGQMAVAPDVGLDEMGALFWEEPDGIAPEQMPQDAATVLAVAVFGQRKSGAAPLAPAFWWRIPVGDDGRARPLAGESVAVMVEETRHAAALKAPDLLIRGNRDALYVSLFALSCANAPYDGDEGDLMGWSLHVADLISSLDRAGGGTLGIGHAMAACSHLFAPQADGRAR
ncbi:MAG: hypothetical protein ACR2HO_04880 [Rubrobacteraceae bacterium]